MAATETVAKGRGRPRAFDEDEVLDALVQLFWEQGFEAASMNEIVEAAGLNKSSLYNAFGSKDELFFTVLERYLDHREAMLLASLGEGGLDALEGFFAMVRMELGSEVGAHGCLAVNATTELGLRDSRAAVLSERYRTTIRTGFRGPLERAAEAGEIDPALVDAYAATLTSAMLGLSVTARGGASTAELNATVDSIEALVRSWKR